MKLFLILLSTFASTFILSQTKPATIKVRKDASLIADGKMYYVQDCKVCHDNPKLGPKLNGVTEKYSKQWVIDFTINSEKLIHLKDKQALKIWLEWKKAPMTVYEGTVPPDFGEKIYAYLKTLKK
ncbi:MAG: hypothetical protein K0S33_3749 [Bacteroidetes bacterium]|nr:hypothetical protein [Bacteroidota bacterium]